MVITFIPPNNLQPDLLSIISVTKVMTSELLSDYVSKGKKNSEQLPVHQMHHRCLDVSGFFSPSLLRSPNDVSRKLHVLYVPYWGHLARRRSCPYLYTRMARFCFFCFPRSAIPVSLSAFLLPHNIDSRHMKKKRKKKRKPWQAAFTLSLTRVKGTVLGFTKSELRYEL